MNTENFSFTLKKYITNSKLSVSTLSKYSNINRSLIQKYISGYQLPSNNEVLERLISCLAITDYEKKEIKQLYKREKIGYENCEKLNIMMDFINRLCFPTTSFDQSFKIQVDLPNQIAFANNVEELKILLYSFLSSVHNDNNEIEIMLNIDDTLFPIIYQFLKQENFKVNIILCFHQIDHLNTNLIQLNRILPFLYFDNVDIHYLYVDSTNNYSLYPYSINSKKNLLFINFSHNQGLLIGNDNYTTEYKFKFSSTLPFIETYLDEFTIQKNLLSFYLNNQKIAYYCGDLFILPFLDTEILEDHYIGKEENKDTILTLFDQFKVNFLDYLAQYKLDLYCQLQDIKDYVIPLGLSAAYFSPFSKHELVVPGQKLINHKNILLNVIKEEKTMFSPSTIIQTNQTKTLVRNEKISFNVLEPSINNDFQLLPTLVKDLEESIYSESESREVLKKFINNI